VIRQLEIVTTARVELIDITTKISQVVSESDVKEGVCYIFVPHTTAAITINENADLSVRQDILNEFNKIVPLENRYSHREGNADAHIKSTLIGTSQVVPVENGRLVLGTWQGIYFCEFDGPRRRRVLVKVA